MPEKIWIEEMYRKQKERKKLQEEKKLLEKLFHLSVVKYLKEDSEDQEYEDFSFL